MKTTRFASRVLATAVAAGFWVSSANAAVPFDCSARSEALCKTPAFLNACDSASVRSYCTPILDTALQQGATITRKLYDPNQPKLQRNLLDGKARPFAFVAPTRSMSELILDSMSQGINKEERRARQRAWVLSPDPSHADAWTRNASWESNGVANTSCEEVVYDSFYTYQRFIDATYRCKQDADCIANLADKRFLPTSVAPGSQGGIRDMRTRWGDPSPVGGSAPGMRGIVPKNAFTTEAAVAFLPEAVINQFPSNYGISLRNTREYMFYSRLKYAIGVAGGFRNFPNEVDYHIALRNLVTSSGVSAAEQNEMRKRQKELSRRIRDFAQRYHRAYEGQNVEIDIDPTGHVHMPGPDTLSNEHGKEVPLDSLTDRALLNLIGSTQFAALNMVRAADADFFTVPRNVVEDYLSDANLGRTYQADVNAFEVGRTGGGVWIGSKDIGSLVNEALTHVPVVRDTTKTDLQLRCPSASAGWNPGSDEWQQMAEDACQISNLILGEISRDWIQGDRGCLTRNFDGCDWSAQEFVDRFAFKQFATHERDDLLQQCAKVTQGFSIPNTFVPVGPSGQVGTITFAQAKADGKKMATFLANGETATRDTVGAIPLVSPSNPSGFGQSLSQWELIGDKSLFAGGYSGSMGWTAELIKSANGDLCRMNADMHGDLDVDVYIFNRHKSIVDAHALASVINGSGHAEAHLNVMDYPAFTEVNRTINLNGLVNELWNEREEDSVTLGTLTFTAGPIPVTISAGAGWFYGANFSTQLRAPTSCLANQNKTTLATLLETNNKFEPFAGVDGWASLDAGVPGVLSVGISAELNLITVSVPVFGNVRVGIAPNAMGYPNVVAVTFDAGAKLRYSTLSGAVDLTFKALFIPVEIRMFSWDGISGEATLVKNPAITVPLVMLPRSTAH